MQQSIYTFFPAEPSKEKSQRLTVHQLLDIRRKPAVAGSTLRIVDPIGYHHYRWKFPVETYQLIRLEIRCRMNGGCVLQVRFLEQMDPCRFGKPTAPFSHFPKQHAPRRDHIRNMRLFGQTRGCPGWPKENGVQMHQTEPTNLLHQRMRERRCP